MSFSQQDTIFVTQEADAWFERNAATATIPASPDDPVLKALRQVELPSKGLLLDVGGAAGRLAAGFQRDYPEWTCHVIEPSAKAIAAGKDAFPHLEFHQASITQAEGFSLPEADLIIVAGVLYWVDRHLLSRAICNIDLALKNGSFLVISEFDSPSLKANEYRHYPGLYTYKQDYTKIFQALGTYHLIYRFSELLENHSSSDTTDYYDRQYATTVLRKDLQGRYFKRSL